jgi:hypothetical protein
MRRILVLVAAVVAVAATSACEIGFEHVAPQPAELAVHGVLDGQLPLVGQNQFIILERTHAGQTYLLRPDLQPGNLPLTDDGIGEELATVTIEAPDGTVYTGTEPVPSGSTRQVGFYVFQGFPASALVGGGLYKLSVTTTKGEVLTAETRVPARTTPPANPVAAFNRALDTLQLSWAPVAGARGYSIRISGPWGPFILTTEETSIRVTGQLRNLGGDGLPRAFLPGFRHTVSIVAVDSSFYDYYRTSNDATGRGIVSNVRGGHGFFGSVMMVHQQAFDVTAPLVDPIDGAFDRIITATEGNYWASEVTLYVESKGSRSDQGDGITGNYRLTPTGPVARIIGSRLRDSVELIFLGGTGMAKDTADNFNAIWRGRLKGDTLDGKFIKGAIGRFIRR